MKNSVSMFLGVLLTASLANAAAIGFATTAKLFQVQCAGKGQSLTTLKTFPALVNDTVLTFKHVSDAGGTFEYMADFSGLTGGDCKNEFSGDYHIQNADVLTLIPKRSSFVTSNGSFDSACRTLRVDQTVVFRIKRLVGRTTDPVYLQLDGEDATNLCGGFRNSARVRLLFKIIGQGPTN